MPLKTKAGIDKPDSVLDCVRSAPLFFPPRTSHLEMNPPALEIPPGFGLRAQRAAFLRVGSSRNSK
jgi:hypothetical protein